MAGGFQTNLSQVAEWVSSWRRWGGEVAPENISTFSEENISMFSFYSVLLSVTTRLAGKISGTFSNIRNFIKNPAKFEFEYFYNNQWMFVYVYVYQPLILTPFQADSDILRVSTEEGREVPFSFLETTKKL